MRSLVAALLVVAACSSNESATPKKAAPPPPKAPETAAPEPAHTAPASQPVVQKTAPAPLDGMDFTPQAKTLFRVAACGSDDPLPEGFDKRLIDSHCKQLRAAIADYRKEYLDKAAEFLPTIVPKGLPDKIVYPFGGGGSGPLRATG